MTIDEIQSALKFDMDMMLFDADTGEIHSKESLKYGNEMNYIHYCAEEQAIELLDELKQLKDEQCCHKVVKEEIMDSEVQVDRYKCRLKYTYIFLIKNTLHFYLYVVQYTQVNKYTKVRKKDMKRTDYKLCVGKHNGYDIYRAVITDGNDYYIKKDEKLLNVTEERKNFTYK